jgi:hypothetical protein
MIRKKAFKILFRFIDGLDEFTCALMCWVQVVDLEHDHNDSAYFWDVLDNRPSNDR